MFILVSVPSTMFSTVIRNISQVSKSVVTRSITNAAATNSKQAQDPQQEAMLKDQCFLVDDNDKIIGQASKQYCHLVQENGDIPLHRAFSVFLFNKKGDLLLQKRASEKVYDLCYESVCLSID